jgi:putative transposase
VHVQGHTLLLPTGGGRGKQDKPSPTIRAELTKPVPAGYQEVAISRDARGHYHASFVYEVAEGAAGLRPSSLCLKTLAVGYNGRGRFYHIGGFKGARLYSKQLGKLRSRRDRCQKKSRRYMHISRVYQRVSERKRNKRTDCLHKASHLLAHKLP